MQQRLPSLRETPILFAHRGARAHAAENTLDAFALALEMGANGLESDVWLTADSVAVLDHAGSARGRLRRTRVGSVPRERLPPHIPALAEVFAELGTDFHLSLDLKDPASIGAVLDAMGEGGFPPGQAWLCSPSIEVLEACAQRGSGVHLVHSFRRRHLDGSLEKHLAGLVDTGVDTVNLRHDEWSGGDVVLCHRFALNAFGWDLHHPEEIVTGLRMGLDGVYGDRVDLLVEVCAAEIGAPRPPSE